MHRDRTVYIGIAIRVFVFSSYIRKRMKKIIS